MNTIREAIRLVKQLHLNQSEAATSLGIGRSTLQEQLKRFDQSKLKLEDFLAMNDEKAKELLFPISAAKLSSADKPEPDMDYILQELAKPCVTAKLLWEEYRKEHPTGVGYTQFCERIKAKTGRAALSMRREHIPGKTVFADYSGKRPEVVDKNRRGQKCGASCSCMGLQQLHLRRSSE